LNIFNPNFLLIDFYRQDARRIIFKF
jgi:hypothetical protein